VEGGASYLPVALAYGAIGIGVGLAGTPLPLADRIGAGATVTAEQYRQCAPQIVQAAKMPFVLGADSAYLAGIAAIVLGGALVFLVFPTRRPRRGGSWSATPPKTRRGV
jgi:hypothetical protein